ncbi:hypothetical protein ACFVTX_06180 [Agromyces sp. NPDC058136]|uniref:hypothetical protein n=1 Tax=Agromyces sp. NPDC058136 TaxID=3346354 RepID=UPI0036DDD89D
MSSRSWVPDLVRGWPMLAALGAGLVLTATAAGAIASGAADVAGGTGVGGGAAGVALAGCGLAALGWAVLALHTGRVPAPRTVLAASLGALAASGLLPAAGSTAAALGIAVMPLLAADVFVVVVALGAAGALRGGPRADRRRARSPGAPAARSVLGLVVGAALVAALATPALAGTAAGELAVPHGELHVSGHGHP